jgi:hypothetical protein
MDTPPMFAGPAPRPANEDEVARDRGRAWSRDEVDLIVADHFEMLRSELTGKP